MSVASRPCLLFSDIVEIHRSAETVWAVLTDFARYGAWNSLCRSISAEARIGGAVEMQIDDPRTGGVTMLSYRVAALEPPRRLAWDATFAELGLTARRDQLLQPLAHDRCAYLTTDLYSGPGAQAAFAANAHWVRESFNAMAFALKNRVETL